MSQTQTHTHTLNSRVNGVPDREPDTLAPCEWGIRYVK